jgi:hypothetical protein
MEKVDEKQLKAWTEAHELVTEIEYEGNFFYFKKPNKTVVGIAMAEEANGNPFAWADALLANCLLSGDKSAVAEDLGFLEGLKQKADTILGVVKCDIEKTDAGMAVTWADGKTALLKKVDRQTYKAVITMAKSGDMPGAFQMCYKNNLLEGDKDLVKDMSYLFALIKKQNDWFGMVDLAIKNYSRNWTA